MKHMFQFERAGRMNDVKNATSGTETQPVGDRCVRSCCMTQAARDPLYRRHRFPAEVIADAVWLHLRFPLSLRMVEDLISARGIIVSHQTVRHGVEKFGRHFAGEIRGRYAGRLGDKGTSMRSSSPLTARSTGCDGL